MWFNLYFGCVVFKILIFGVFILFYNCFFLFEFEYERMRNFGCVLCLIDKKMSKTRKKLSFELWIALNFGFLSCLQGENKKQIFLFQFMDYLEFGNILCLFMKNWE